jgi:hypothetical protein
VKSHLRSLCLRTFASLRCIFLGSLTQLQIVNSWNEIKSQTKPFSRFLYRSFIIINLYRPPITLSFTTLSEEISRFFFCSSAINGFFLLDFLGIFVFFCNFFIPVYPLSVISQQSFLSAYNFESYTFI